MANSTDVPVSQDSVFANLHYDDIIRLERKLLTLGDLAFVESKQRKAFNSLVREYIWFDWAEHLDRTDKNSPVGMPIPGIDVPIEE